MRIVLVSGIPGAGKTTMSRALAQRWERSAHVESDLVGEAFIVGGRVLPGEEPARESNRQLVLRRRNICALVRNFADAGFDVIIDDVIMNAGMLEVYVRGLAGLQLHLVQLLPTLEIAALRDAGRDKHVFTLWSHLDAELRAWVDPPGLWIDTSALSVDESLAVIEARLGDAELAD